MNMNKAVTVTENKEATILCDREIAANETDIIIKAIRTKPANS